MDLSAFEARLDELTALHGLPNLQQQQPFQLVSEEVSAASVDTSTPSFEIPGRYVFWTHEGFEHVAKDVSELMLLLGLTEANPVSGLHGVVQVRTTEEDDEVDADWKTHVARIPWLANGEPVMRVDVMENIQSLPGWNLDRVDQKSLPLDGYFRRAFDGSGVDIYIFDTGVSEHTQLKGRVAYDLGYDAYGADKLEDCHGHGTHVAAIAAGSTVGVSSGARVVPYRVLECSGYGNNVLIAAALTHYLNSTRTRPGIINMSIGGGASILVDNLIQKVVDDGTPVFVAAGNSKDDACNYSPSRASAAFTVGATDWDDNLASFSNYGSCVNIYAPGVSIISANFSHPSNFRTMSGTSMATPLVAGLAAWIIQREEETTRIARSSSLVNQNEALTAAHEAGIDWDTNITATFIYSALEEKSIVRGVLDAPLVYTGRFNTQDQWFGQDKVAWFSVMGFAGFFILLGGIVWMAAVYQIRRERRSMRIPWEESSDNSGTRSPLLSQV